MEGGQNTTPGMMWYNYPVDGIITTGTPVQVELGSVDIARQINQQVQLQYGSLQAVPAQPGQIIVATHQPQQVSSPPSPDPPPNPKQPKPRSRQSNGERVPCTECGKTFSCNANLRDHMRLHTGERPFICTECGMSFAQRSNWRLHKRVHTGERPYMCGICGKTFARSSHLPGHMRVHTGERPYSCLECEHSFASAQALKNHARTHTGEKPFVCEYCQTAFTHSSSLSSHKKRCTGEKRKRGRPLGSGRKSYRKKPTGRPRGRPRKKGRTGKKGRRKITVTGSEIVMKQEGGADAVIVKAEVHTDAGQEDSHDSAMAVAAKQEVEEEVPTVIVDAADLTAADPLALSNENSEMECPVTTHHQHQQETEIISADIVTHQHLNHQQQQQAVVTTSLEDTNNLHQEAAVAMAALHEGAALNLAHHHLGQEAYVDRDSHALWFPKPY